MQWLKDMGQNENTIVVFTTDNGAQQVSFPDGGVTPFKGQKGSETVEELLAKIEELEREQQAEWMGAQKERHSRVPHAVPFKRA